MRHDLVDVGQAPPQRREVEGEPLLLAHEEHDVVEAAGRQEGVAPHDRAARQEAEHRRAGQVGRRAQR